MKKQLIYGGLMTFLCAVCATLFGVDNMVEGMAFLTEKSLGCLTNDCVDGLVPSMAAGAAIVSGLFNPDGSKFTIKSDEELEKLEGDEAKSYYDNLLKAQSHTMVKMQDNLKEAEKAQAEKLNSEINEIVKSQNEILSKSLKTQGEKMVELEKTLTDTLAKSSDDKNAIRKALKTNADELKSAIKEGRKYSLEIPDFKTKASMNSADIADGEDFAQMEPGVGQIPTRQVFMKDLFATRPINREFLKYTDQATKVRDAKNVALCAASTHNSKITYEVVDLQMKKVRDFVDVCIDMWEDYDFIAGEVQGLVNMDVQLKVDEGLLLGDGAGANLNGVASQASTFAAGDYATSIQEPTLADLIVVAAAQIADFGENNKYSANVVILNPVDATQMKLEKDADNNYLLPNFISQMGAEVHGVRIIENQLVPQNEMYIMDTRMGVIYQRRGIVVELSFENATNFEQEIVTVKAYERLNLRIRNVDANAFMHVDDIAAALTAITAT